MKKFIFLLLIIAGCNKPKEENMVALKESLSVKKDSKKFYDSDEIDHYYLDISEEKVMKLARVKNKNEEQEDFISLLVSHYPDSITEPNFEIKLHKYKFKKTELNETKKKEVENIFSKKDSIQTEFSSCLPYYRDIFIFKKNDSIIGIAKVCFGCGVSRFLGSEVDTDGFGLYSELNKLKKIIREK
ncbi:hypothetical protein HKT18_13020 [Flavobacterium sp. IMCC34852]|uniref:Uncharacterized protein n=1 Tax=Flavobacterium rivulicola TaxID=2732161 RepID=A0A7Y3VZT3_9FLAO|nr:hypothetical protein [Flavobacterium sp. IMCC34852]NNT73140.1 hypothetical protein [Flavobacterium sp. IMCC34852]